MFNDGGKLFEAAGFKQHLPAAYGLALAADFLTILGVGKASGPSIQDVLNKLDAMSEQLDAIQSQLNDIERQLNTLGAAIAQQFQEIHAATCTAQQGLQSPAVSAVSLLERDYQSLIREEAAVPDARDPKEAVATLEQRFSEFATNVLGPGNSLLVSSWPTAQRINEIHTTLMGSGPDQNGLIRTCGRVSYDQWQAMRSADPKVGWLDDRGYYQAVDDVVRWYQSYEVQALGYIEEAGYLRAAQLYARDYPNEQLDVDQRSAICTLASERHPDSVTARFCQTVAEELHAVRQDVGGEWRLAGVPFSNGNVVLSLPSQARGLRSGQTKAVLWVRKPSALPDGKGYNNFIQPPSMPSYEHFVGWRIATTEDWNDLWNSIREAGLGGPNVLQAMDKSGAFTGILPTSEGPRETSGSLWALPNAFYWIPGETKEMTGPGLFTGPYTATVRCYVEEYFTDGGGIVCSRAYQVSNPGLTGIFAPAMVLSSGAKVLNSVSTEGILANRRPGGQALTAWTPVEPIEWAIPVPDSITVDGHQESCLSALGLPRPCGRNFSNWMDQTIPDPSQPSPEPTGQPAMAENGSATACNAHGWAAGPPELGKVESLPTTWTAQWPTPNASGATTRSLDVPAGQPLNDATFATDGGFTVSQPFRVTCTVNARWAELVNAGSAQSPRYQVTSNGSGYTLTRVPAGPNELSAAHGAPGTVKLSFTLGDTYDSAVTGCTVTPYVGGSARPPIVVPVDPSQPAPTTRSAVSVTVSATPGTTYRYSVAVNVGADGTSASVTGIASSLSDQVTMPTTPAPAAPTATTTSLP